MAKGGRYERKYARILSNWITFEDDDTQLVRSKQSGGWSRKKYRQAGDLAANGSIGRDFRSVFIVEIKARDSFEFRHVWSSTKPGLAQWWEKVCGEGEDFDLIPLLVYSKPYHPDLIGLPPDLGKVLMPESPCVIVDWGARDYPTVFLTELDELIALDPDWVIDCGERFRKDEL